MKTLVFAAVAATLGTSQPHQCKIVINYASDTPALATLELPDTIECGNAHNVNIALAAAYNRSIGKPPDFTIGPMDNPTTKIKP